MESKDAVFGFGASAFLRLFLGVPSSFNSAGSSGNISVMYGPKRPDLATTSSPVLGSIPSSRSPEGAARSSIALVSVNSSGAKF